MAIFTLQDSHAPLTPRRSAPVATSESRMVMAIGIAVIVMIAAVALAGILFIKNYSAKFRKLDNSQSSIAMTETQTVYTNLKYGVTLKLPGKWQRAHSPYESFCTLSGGNGLAAMFWPIFPAPGATVDQDAELISQGYVSRGNWRLVSNSQAVIHGRAGRIMRFQTSFAGQDLQLAVVKKWPVVYALAITGPRDSSGWPGITDALPQSIEVK